MPTNPPQQPADAAAVEAAIAQVLQAEQAARAATQADAELARLTIELAQAQAGAIAERAARCTARVHQWADARIAQQLALIAEQRVRLSDAGDSSAGSADARKSMDMVVARLAAELSGETA